MVTQVDSRTGSRLRLFSLLFMSRGRSPSLAGALTWPLIPKSRVWEAGTRSVWPLASPGLSLELQSSRLHTERRGYF